MHFRVHDGIPLLDRCLRRWNAENPILAFELLFESSGSDEALVLAGGTALNLT
jgi:hypothetical protein